MQPFLIKLGRRTFSPAGITIAYAVVGTLWIIFSDRLLPMVTGDGLTVEQLTRLQTLKGVLYIALTAGFIYLLTRTSARMAHTSDLAREEIRSRYEQIFLRTGAVVLITEADTGTILEANPAAIKFYGWPRAELLGKNLVELTVQSDELVRGEFEAAAIERRDFLLLRHRTASGAIRDIALNATPITTPRRKLDYVLIYDLTRQRDLENQLRQSQKMEAVGQLTGGIAHDLNNILTVVLADADLLAEQLPQHPEVKEDLNDLRAAARRGATMIRKLLSFSRASKLSLVNVDLGPAIADLTPVIQRMMAANVEVTFKDMGAGRVLVDAGALEQIVLNLATNSRDALPRGGIIRLETGRALLSANDTERWIREGAYVYLKVSDNGIGMDERTQSRMFEPFFTTKDTSEGAGLGMAMVYGLVKQHEGFITTDSSPGRGTTVTIYLPPAPAFVDTAPEPKAKPECARPEGGEMILLVEDEVALQRAAQRILERLGYRVIVALNGEAALEVLGQRGGEVDLVISDLSMPRLGGPELYKEARSRGYNMRFLFSSGYVPSAHAALPDVPFLPKPWTYTELANKVKEVLGQP
ncbi:MAG TPA: ATP-binding protein [Gemmatimonadales bacterium]|jgi:PAS domain S-box-containing protein|nr:ATP-binding protein [Gemmatimonadales bacterium]